MYAAAYIIHQQNLRSCSTNEYKPIEIFAYRNICSLAVKINDYKPESKAEATTHCKKMCDMNTRNECGIFATYITLILCVHCTLVHKCVTCTHIICAGHTAPCVISTTTIVLKDHNVQFTQ